VFLFSMLIYDLHHDHFFCRGSDSDVKLTVHSSFHSPLFINVLILMSIRHIFLFSPFLKVEIILFHTDFNLIVQFMLILKPLKLCMGRTMALRHVGRT
jgi:hypothetical protein